MDSQKVEHTIKSENIGVTRGTHRMVQVDLCDSLGSSQSSLPEVISTHNLGDSSTDKDVKMPTFDQLPLEVKEVIFLYLNPRDLKQGSLVCKRWHDIVNSNRVWLKICELHGLSKKKYLDDAYSMIENPMKHYSYKDERLAPSHWRSHFNRYRFVQRNWKEGYFVVYKLPLKPIHMNEHCVIEHIGNKLIVSSVHGKVKRFCTIDLILPESKIDTIICKNDYLIYTQNRFVVCLKKETETFREVIRVTLEDGNCNQPKSDCIKSQFTIRISDKFVLIQDPLNPCMLCFIETNDSSVRRLIDLHKALGNQSLLCTCIEALGDKVFLGYRMGTGTYIAQYDYSKDVWEGQVLSIPSKAVELYVSQKFVCAKLSIESREEQFEQPSNLYAWSRDPLYKVGEFCANKHVPVVLSDSDIMIYSFRDEIVVRKLGGSHEMSFSVSPSVMNICQVWNKYLVVHDEKGISIWDLVIGKKVVSPLRSETCITVCASETNILLRCEDDRFLVVSFW